MAGVPKDPNAPTFEDEWAHLGSKKRFKTRGMEPEDRHSTQGTMRLCAYHHRAEDNHRMRIDVGDKGADGPVRFVFRLYGGVTVTHTERGFSNEAVEK